MSAGFTPGPWRVQGHGGTRTGGSAMQYPCLVGSIWAESGQKIVQYGTLLGVQGDSPDEAEANARLIAASPTMAAYIQRKSDEGDEEAARIMEAIHARR